MLSLWLLTNTSVFGRLTGNTTLQNHCHSILLEEYVLKTCPGVQKVVLGIEYDQFRDHQSQLFLMTNCPRHVSHCEQVADFSELDPSYGSLPLHQCSLCSRLARHSVLGALARQT